MTVRDISAHLSELYAGDKFLVVLANESDADAAHALDRDTRKQAGP
jgi:hypothetical protein